MKKVLIVVLVVIMVLSIGVVGATAAGFGSDHGGNKACVNGVCDSRGANCNYTDADGDGVCDNQSENCGYYSGQAAGHCFRGVRNK